MTQRIKYSTLGFLFGSILFLSVSAYASSGIWSIGNGFMVFQQQGDSADVNVGIGISNPDQKLVVDGKIKSASTNPGETDGQVVTTVDYVTDKISALNEGKWKSSGETVYRNAGKVGIFAENPDEMFEVNGTSRFLDDIKIGASDDVIGKIGKNSSGIFLQASDTKKTSLFNALGKGLTVENSGDITVDQDLETKGALSFYKLDWNAGKNINLLGSGDFSFDFSENTGSSEFHIYSPGVGSLFSIKSDGLMKFNDSLNVISKQLPSEDSHLANKKYVDATVSAGSDWQKNTYCADSQKFLGFENGEAKCAEDTGGSGGSGGAGGIKMSVFRESGTFTVPAGVYKIKATLYGGGGSVFQAGVSAGGGGWTTGLIDVTPGEEIPFTVGEGGEIPTTNDRTKSGGSSSIKNLSAFGGAGAADNNYNYKGGGYSGGYIGDSGHDGETFNADVSDLSGRTTGPYGSIHLLDYKKGFGQGGISADEYGQDGAVILEW